MDYHQDIVISGGLRFTPYHAGHVLGASMFMIEIAGLKILYTGDYSREEDRHLVIAEIPPVKPDVMICESTFGVHTLPDRKDKEEQFTSESITLLFRSRSPRIEYCEERRPMSHAYTLIWQRTRACITTRRVLVESPRTTIRSHLLCIGSIPTRYEGVQDLCAYYERQHPIPFRQARQPVRF